MEFREYQENAAVTANKELGLKDRLMVAALGLCGESGEVAELFKKHYGHSHSLDINHLKKELGDCLWYISEICTVLGLNFDDIPCENIEKLRKRYPAGFEAIRSIERTNENG